MAFGIFRLGFCFVMVRDTVGLFLSQDCLCMDDVLAPYALISHDPEYGVRGSGDVQIFLTFALTCDSVGQWEFPTSLP